VLARALDPADRRRLLDAVPTELHDDYATHVPYDPGGLPGFRHQVATIVNRTPDQSRYPAQAVLSVMCEQDGELMCRYGCRSTCGISSRGRPKAGLSAWTDVRRR
jgi:hypothetical protein